MKTTLLPNARTPRPALLVLGAFLLLTAWVGYLRWPTFGAILWNVDESIHAAIARILLHGGVLYRDGVDQRTPLTYYVVALVFRLFGENNLWALRAVTSLVISTTALGLFLLGRRAHRPVSGVWAALIFCALTTNLFYFEDANAVNTEWFVILFTTWGTWWFWRTRWRTDLAATVPTGVCFALAFLSKQPAALDLAVPLLTLGFLAAAGQAKPAAVVRAAAGILLGFLVVVAATFAYFAVHGAFGDFIFYTLSYNLLYYGADVTAAPHLLAAFVPFARLGQRYPLVLVALLAALGLLLFRTLQRRPTAEERAGQPWSFYLLAWTATSLLGAAASGRRFEHYFIQCLPAFALGAGWLLAETGALIRRLWRRADGSRLARTAALPLALFLAATGAGAIVRPLVHRGTDAYPNDPAYRCSRFIRRLTTPAERIFVWGFNPDIYLYTNRMPASRFVYCSFQTGLIPWTNIAPHLDTSYAIVPGTMGTLLADLEARRPAFFVDCSAGPHRHFAKYPITKFPDLKAFVSRNYLEANSAEFVPQGFRLHLIKDRARLIPVRLAGGPAGHPQTPEIFGPPLAGPVATPYLVGGHDPDGRLQRLELRADGKLIDSVSFQPTDQITVQFEVPFDRLGSGEHRLVARAVSANGATRDSAALAVTCAPSVVPPEELPEFGLPFVTTTLLPLTVRAPFAPSAQPEDGHHVLSLHAPSLLTFALAADARSVSGGFGIHAGAYAPENHFPTDGAEFFVRWIAPTGEVDVLLHRWLRPRDHPTDRPMQFFALPIPPHPAGSRLEFVITPGPYGNNASDWTYWSDLRLKTSR